MFDPAQKTTYDRDGFLVVPALFNECELSPIRTQVDALIADPDHPPKGVTVGREGNTAADRESFQARDDSVRSAAFLVRFLPLFQDFARQPKLLDLIRGLLGPRVKVFRDQALFKPPGSQAKPLHQDQSYFKVKPQDRHLPLRHHQRPLGRRAAQRADFARNRLSPPWHLPLITRFDKSILKHPLTNRK